MKVTMAATSSQALTKRSSDSELMPPPPPRKRIKRPAKVLDENAYTSCLSQIIARDFFPGLVETEAQREYLSAIDSQHPEWIAEARQKLVDIRTPGPGTRTRWKKSAKMTPGSQTPGPTPRGQGGETTYATPSSEAETQTQQREVDMNMSLSTFQQKYTSEDNESFYKLLDKQNAKKAEKYTWLHNGNKIPAARQIAYRQQQQSLVASKADQEAEDGRPLALVSQDQDSRQAAPDGWKSKPDNALMFLPSSIEDIHQTVAQKAEEDSRAGPKAVVYNNTRFAPQAPVEPAVPPSPSLSAVRDAIAGRPRPAASESGASGSETPRVNGYAFVDDEEPDKSPPSSPPRSTMSFDSSLFDPQDKVPNPFKVNEASKREDLHHRMVDKAAKGKRREQLIREEKTPIPKFVSSPRVVETFNEKGGLTPAARRLLGKVGGKTPRVGESPWEGKTPRAGGLRGLATPRGGK